MSDRFYLVTFDLKDSKGREAEYRKADEALRFRYGQGNVWRIVKQCRIVRTRQDAAQVRDGVNQTLGGNCNILVVRLKRGFAYKLMDPHLRTVAKGCLPLIPS